MFFSRRHSCRSALIGYKECVKGPILATIAIPAVVGFTAIAGQIVLMREVMVLYSGNELSAGIVLGAWLMWTAIGSGIMSRLLRDSKNLPRSISAAQCLSSLSLLATICVLRGARAHLQVVPGESLGPATIALVSIASLSVFCGLSGCLFVLAAQKARKDFRARIATSFVYLLETAGSALGGILTSVLLLRFFGSFQIALIVAVANLCVASHLTFKTSRMQRAMSATTVALGIVLIAVVAPRMEQVTQQWVWKGFALVTSRDSIYGRLAVLNTGGLGSICENGTVITNVPDLASAEETIHYAMLEHPAPRTVLLIGGGINGSVVEALKHPSLTRLDYVEMDPELIAMYRQDFQVQFDRAFSDPRVHVHNVDGRLFLKAGKEKFDEIVLSVPDPENAQLNRFYTAEFFQTARDHLSHQGLLELKLRSSEESIGPELGDFLKCVFNTLQGVFPRVAVIPGATIHMLGAVDQNVLTEDPDVLIDRIKSRHLQTLYVSEYSIPFRMMPDRMAQIHDLLRPFPETPTNRDFHPLAYYFGAVLWSAQFKSVYAHFLQNAGRIHFRTLLFGVIALSVILVLISIALRRSRIHGAAIWTVTTTGFTLMALQVLLLLTFQSVYGYVFHALAMLIGMFMAGMALGCWLGLARIRECELNPLLRQAAINQVMLAVSAPLMLALVSFLSGGSSPVGEPLVASILFPLLAVLCGIPGGYQFPIASEIYRQCRPDQSGIGTLYAFDSFGGCLGALVLAGFLIPVFGFWNTSWLIAAVSVPPAIVAFVASVNSVASSY